MSHPRSFSGFTATILVLAAILVLGFTRVAMLPPFEGYDESGHYSYVGQLAATGQWPRRGDPMAAEIDRYIEAAPTSPSMRRTQTYAEFAAATPDGKAAARTTIQMGEAGSPWGPGTIGNWEAQHPPLYYALLAPAYRLAEGWSLAARLLLLRSLSYVTAWLGLCLAAYAAATTVNRTARTAAVASVALWPVLLPEWFPEMARIGNDCLLVPLAGLSWLALRRALADGRLGSAIRLGVLIGLGLLTKATFLPMAAAVGLVLAARAVAADRERGRRLLGVLLCGAAILAVAGWWYVGQFAATGDPIGANDDINLAQEGGLWRGLQQHAALGTLLRMFGTFDLSLVWDGSWSFVIPPLAAILPMMVLVPGLVAVGLHERWTSLSAIDSVTPLTFALFALALIYHSQVLIATGGSGAPAWYLQAFMPVLWPFLAWGFEAARLRPVFKGLLVVLVVYAAAFLLVVTLCDAALYAGCAIPVGNGRFFAPAQVLGCLAAPLRLAAILDILAYPTAAAASFVLGAVLLLAGTVLIVRRLFVVPDPIPVGSSAVPATS